MLTVAGLCGGSLVHIRYFRFSAIWQRLNIALPVTLIFRKSIDTGCVCVPYWTGELRTLNLSSEKLASTTSTTADQLASPVTIKICKVVESVLRDEVVQHLDKHNLIYGTQHGFRKGYSCTTNLLVFLVL